MHQPQASCIEPGLAIRFIYDIIHVSMPFSQIIQPLPSPTESKRLFYTSVSLLLSHIQGYRYHLSKLHIYALVYCIGVFLSAAPVSSTSLELIQMYSFQWLSNTPLCTRTAAFSSVHQQVTLLISVSSSLPTSLH